jgi:hypothetical protein
LAPADALPEVRNGLLSVLGLPSPSLTAWPTTDSTSAFRLLLGEDYEPCFDPSALAEAG